MYHAHFGLAEAPFRITPNTEVFFVGGNRGAILDALIYAIAHGEGIVKVTGEVGSGKTMLCNMLASRLPPEVETVYLAHPSVSPEEILHAIAFEMQLDVPKQATRLEVMQAIHSYLLERHAQGRQVVIFVEESQNMPLATLEEVRLLSNLETASHKLLQIVLFGQPELDENLLKPQIRQLRERIAHSFQLAPLNTAEIGEYLMFRLRAVGYRGPDLFSPSVVRHIAAASKGLTRRVNLIADKALLAAFSDNTHTVKLAHVTTAIRDSEFARDAPKPPPPKGLFAAGMIALGAVAGALLLWAAQQYDSGSPAPTVQPSPSSPAVKPVVEPATSGIAADAAQPALNTPREPQSEQPSVPRVAAAQQPPASLPPLVAKPPQPPEKTKEKQREPIPAGADSLEERLAATQIWLQSAAQDTHTIQILGGDDIQQLKQHLNIISKFIEINKVFVYRTMAKQKPYLAVLYGSFGSRQEAEDALGKLPAQLKAYRPLLRTVQGIRAELSQIKAL